MRGKFRKWVIWYMATAIFLIGSTPRVHAGFSPSEAIQFSSYDRTADLQKIQKILESKMIRERLGQLGFAEEEIQQRLNQLSHEQIHQLASKLDDLKVAGNGAEVVISLFVIAILIIILVYLLGHHLVIKKA